jgi:hypothetical protein
MDELLIMDTCTFPSQPQELLRLLVKSFINYGQLGDGNQYPLMIHIQFCYH